MANCVSRYSQPTPLPKNESSSMAETSIGPRSSSTTRRSVSSSADVAARDCASSSSRPRPQRALRSPSRYCRALFSFFSNSSSRSKLSSQYRWYSVAQTAISRKGPACSRHQRRWASRRRSMSPAFSRTLRCLETAGWLIGRGSASSWTVASPCASRARMVRRVGSATAWKVAESVSSFNARSAGARRGGHSLRSNRFPCCWLAYRRDAPCART